MIKNKDIDKALKFYNLDLQYRKKCIETLDAIKSNKKWKKSFKKIFHILYKSNFQKVKKLWDTDIKEIIPTNTLFLTNLLIISGYRTHFKTMKKMKLNQKQIEIHKKRVRECFLNDLMTRNYNMVRMSQMLWATYFIRGRIIEVGSLQYEYIDKKNIKIHIPKKTDLQITKVMESLNNSKIEIKTIFKITSYQYKCNSWLLSNQVNEVLDTNTNISKFYHLFHVIDGEDCIKDILNFVYNVEKCENYKDLPETTILQRKIKEKLLKNETFYLGIGTLKQ